MSSYSASRDAFVWGLTLFVLGIMALVGFGIAIVTVTRPSSFSALLLPVVALLNLFILGFAYRYAPGEYRITNEALEIHRPAGPVRLPLASIHEVEARDDWLGLEMKVPPGGNSGLFGIYGRFYSKSLGAYDMYGTRARGAVLLRTAGGPVIVTPDRRDLFMAELRERLGALPGAV